MTFIKKHINSFIILLVLLSLISSSIIFYQNLNQFNSLDNQIIEFERKKTQLRKLYNKELKTVRAKRGYQYSKFGWELSNYLNSKKETLIQLDSVKTLFPSAPYLAKFDSLESSIKERIAQFDQHIAFIQFQTKEQAKFQILDEEGKMREGSEKLNRIFSSFNTALNADIKEMNRLKDELTQESKLSFFTLILITFVLLTLLYFSSKKRKKKELIHLETKEREDLFSSSFEHAPIGMALVSNEGKWIKVNQSLCNILGYSNAELTEKTFQEVTHPDDLNEDLTFLKQMIKGEINSYQMEKRYLHKNGTVIWAILGVSAVRNADHSIKFFVSQIQNISQRKEAQEKLLKEKLRVSNLIEATNAGTWEWNVQTGEAIFNERWAELIGYKLEELKPTTVKTWEKFTHPDDLEKAKESLRKCFNGENSYYEVELRQKHKNGHLVWVLVRGKVISWTKDGKPLWMFGTHINITELKEINLALQKNEQRFKGIFNSTFQLMGFLNIDGTLWEANNTALNFAGLKPEDVIGKKFWNTHLWQISTQVQEDLKLAIQKAANGETVNYEVAVWDKDKIPTTILFNLKPLINPNFNEVEAIIAEGRPIQELVDARNALLSKNEELKSFATLAAHDLKEPSRTISSFMKLLKAKYSNSLDDKGMQYINYAVDAGGRMNNLISDLLEHTKIGTDDVEFERVDTQKLIGEVVDLHEAILSEKNAKVVFDNLPAILGQKTTVRLLFQNLISNALKYHKKEEPPLIKISAKEKGKFYEFKIEDNGIGIEPKYHDKIFLMFRRLHTRKEYAGTGMGLATCKKIVQHHGGEIGLTSEVGKGSAFYFTLPKA